MDRATLEQNFAAVEARIAAACARAKRARTEVTLVAVSKLHPPELISLAWELGHRDFGENYAQELRDKHAALKLEGLRWHAIGPLQPKNAKYVAKAAHTFHALDSVEVATELSRRREGNALRCLLEVNVAKEISKAGVTPAEVPALLAAARALPRLEVVGLTAMPPLVEDPELNRPHFETLAKLAREHGLRELSMGSTGDYEVAIEAGATLVRVGTALFGHRPT
ncbi:MAG: YggS family pyridoxal phosphate-dependent enzyme [Myxococcaceae bacterium]